jgi:hypothetical protein
VLSLEDKKQITMVVSCSDVMDLLPPIVFTSTTFKTLPPNNKGKKICIKDGWDLTFNRNHLLSLEQTLSFKKIVTNIILLYLQSHIQILGLKEQKMVWIIDYWSVHISKKILDW